MLYRHNNKGFSLIELSVVLVILSLLMAVIVLRFQSPLRMTQMKDVMDRIAQYDHLTRIQACRENQTLHLVLDGDNRQIRRTDKTETKTKGTPMALPSGFTITDMYIQNQELDQAGGAITISPKGHSATYAIKILTPSGNSRWILFIGVSGKHIQFDNDQDIKDILQATEIRSDIN